MPGNPVHLTFEESVAGQPEPSSLVIDLAQIILGDTTNKNVSHNNLPMISQ